MRDKANAVPEMKWKCVHTQNGDRPNLVVVHLLLEYLTEHVCMQTSVHNVKFLGFTTV